MGTVKIKHSGNIGDVIYSLPAMRQASRNAGKKVEILLLIDQPLQLSPGQSHPNGAVMLTEKIAEMAIPLFESLPFVHSARIVTFPEQVDYDFDKFRHCHKPIPHGNQMIPGYTGSISRWYFHAYPELTCDLSEPLSIDLTDTKIPKTRPIIFNRTTRYEGYKFDYLYLKPYSHLMTFVGLEDEYHRVSGKLPNMEFRPVENFLELALLILNSRFFVGNQSMAFAIAEVFKVPRAIEVCRWAHNVIPCGGEAYDLWTIENLNQIMKSKFPLMTVSHGAA